MSKKTTPKRKPASDPYKRGYTNGVIAAVDALLEDLGERGDFEDDTEYFTDDHGVERSSACKGCELASRGFQHTSDRWSFAIGEARRH